MIKNIFTLLALVSLSGFIYYDNNSFKMTQYTVKDKKIPGEFDNFKIVHLSDLHSNNFGNMNENLIKAINIESPDIIVMTGDMVNKYDRDFKNFLALAKDLSKTYKIYYIVGNHEKRLRKDDLKLLIKILTSFKITILNDDVATIKINNNSINIYGLDIPLSYYKVRNKPQNVDEVINDFLSNCNKSNYNILLAHNPLYFGLYSKYNVNLIFSGHVHGGMIRLPFIGGLLSPERKFFPKYSNGIYELNNKRLIVSRGLGHSNPGIRIFNRPEILSITLTKE